MSTFVTVIVTLLVFMVIITIHEFGHFISAKLLKVRVHEFAIGMGPAVYKRKRGETLYSLRWLPIGGYCKMEGEDEKSEDENSLNKKPVWARFIIVSAGAFLNLVLGLILYFIFYLQYPAIVDTSIAELTPNYPAATQGVQVGDRIVAINGMNIGSYKEVRLFLVTDGQNQIKLTVKRANEVKDINIIPIKDPKDGVYRMGIVFGTIGMTPLIAAQASYNEIFFVSKLVAHGFMQLLTGKVPITEAAGPVGVGAIIGEALKRDYRDFINIFGFLSVNIGIFNLLPFPALDGGRIIFMAIELVRRKPINPEKEGYIHLVGLAILLLFSLFIFSSDIYKLIVPWFGK